MKIALVLDKAVAGGVTVINLMLYARLIRLGHDVRLVFSSSESGNGGFLLKEKKIRAEQLCLGVRSLRKRCRILAQSLKEADVVIFSESKEAQYVASALPDRIVILKGIHNSAECVGKKFLWNQNAVDAYVAVSPVVREMALVRRVHAPVYVVPNCTDFKGPASGDLRKNGLTISYVGRFDDFHKGVLILPRIAEVLQQRGIHARWILAGAETDPDRTRLIDGFKKSGADFEVHAPDRSGVERLLAESDFMIVPSNFEAFGLVVIEGMATGCIPVCSEVPAFSWILGNHSEELQIAENGPEAYADVLCRLLRDDALCKTIRVDLLQRQQHCFSVEATGLAYHRLISQLQSRSGRQVRAGHIRIPLSEQIKDYWWGRISHSIYMRIRAHR
jgi:glycosyltransferase involved in cell wall biosynthesis